MEASTAYSVCTFSGLNLDCLLTIFQHLPLLDCLRLRPQCRSLNHAVCEFLQGCHKLELNLDADRSGDDLERVIDRYNSLQREYYGYVNGYNLKYNDIPKIRSITFSDTVRFHSHLFKNQPHFRCADMIQVNSGEGATDRKVDSLVAFLTTYMPNLRKLALLVSHENYFRSVARLLSPLRKLKVFFIDVNSAMGIRYNKESYPSTQIVEAICGLPELESLYYFRNPQTAPTFRCVPEEYPPHRLSSDENFLEVLLPRLRVLHCLYFSFPVGMTFDKVEEISVDYGTVDSVTKNHFPGVKTLIIDDLTQFYSYRIDDRLSFVNVKVLKLDSYADNGQCPFVIESEFMRALNDLPNLEELHCSWVDYGYELKYNEGAESNNTIVRLYTQSHTDCTRDRLHCPEKIAEFVSVCKKYFRRLQLLTNELPPFVQHF